MFDHFITYIYFTFRLIETNEVDYCLKIFFLFGHSLSEIFAMMIEALVTCTLQSGFYYTIIIKQDKVNEALTLRPENLVYNTSNRSNIQHHE